jgi:hypothetical protein
MTNYLVQAIWEFPALLLSTTQQSASEINQRYQGVANCAEYLRVQAVSLRNSATSLLAELDTAIANLNAQTATFNSLATDAGNKATVADGLQTQAAGGVTRLATANTAVTTARAKLTAAESNANAIIANGLPKSGTNLDQIAAAIPANPGILGVNSTGIWTWYSAPSGTSFVIEFQVFSMEYGPTSNGGAVNANAWNLGDINKAFYGNFRNSIGFPEDVVDEANKRLRLENYTHYCQMIILGSNTDAMRAQMLLNGNGTGRSLSTQMALDTNTNGLRHFNQDSIVDLVLNPSAGSFLQYQTYHNAANSAIPTAGRGISNGKGYNNVYMCGYIWRLRNT